MIRIPIAALRPLIDWLYFYHAWRTPEDSEAGRELRADAEAKLDLWATDPEMATRAVQAFYPAERMPQTPRQSGVNGLAVSDWVTDEFGLFACTVSDKLQRQIEELNLSHADDYELILLQSLASRLAEATSEYLWRQLRWHGIRPAVGYPCLPEQQLIFRMAELLDFAEAGISLTENGGMYPPASVSGFYIQHPDAHYFTILKD